MVLKNLCILVLWTKVASALEGLRVPQDNVVHISSTFDNNFSIRNDLQNI